MKNRKRNRTKGFDYSSNNLYFVTNCVKNNLCCFGNVISDATVGTGRDLSVHHPKNHHPKNHHSENHHSENHHSENHHPKNHHPKNHHSENHHPKNHHSENHHSENHHSEKHHSEKHHSEKHHSEKHHSENHHSEKHHSEKHHSENYHFEKHHSEKHQSQINPFGNVVMELNSFGLIVKNQIEWLENQYSYISIHNYVIMPNHFHLILEIDSSKVNTNEIKIKSLSSLMGALKTTSSKQIRDFGFIDFAWHRSFHDHIIRNEKEYDLISNYIDRNPQKWFEDRFYSGQLKQF